MANKLFLNTPKNVKVRRTTIGNIVRFTKVEKEIDENGNEFNRLVAIARNGKFIWNHSDFPA